MISVDIPFTFSTDEDMKKQNSLSKFVYLLSILLLHVCTLYIFAISINILTSIFDFKTGMAYIISSCLSYFLWYSVNRQEKQIRKLVRMQMRWLARNPSATRFLYTDICILVILTLFPIALGGLSVYFVLFHDYHDKSFSFDYPIKNLFFKCVVNFFGSYSIGLIFSKWPCVALWSMCRVISKAANILHDYNERIRYSFSSLSSSNGNHDASKENERCFRIISPREIREFFGKLCFIREIPVQLAQGRDHICTLHQSRTERRVNSTDASTTIDGSGYPNRSVSFHEPLREVLAEYFKIVEMVSELRDVLSIPSLFLTVFSFLCLYLILSSNLFELLLTSNELKLSTLELLLMCFTGCTILLLLGYCGAKIPQGMFEIRTTCRYIINANETGEIYLSSKERSLLERLEKVDLVNISAGGFVVFSRSFILTSFGSILTFGLLIFNLGIE